MIAFDTNILVYAQQEDFDARHRQATDLIASAVFASAIMSVQVLGEFLNICIRKFKIAPIDAVEQIGDYLQVFECPQTDAYDLTEAASLVAAHQLQFFDALIIVVATRAGATMLLSEDMQDGFEIDGLKIVNPFAAANETLLADYFGSAL